MNIGDKVRVYDEDEYTGEKLDTSYIGTITGKHITTFFCERWEVTDEDGSRGFAKESNMELIQEDKMEKLKETISLEDAYNAGMSREGLYRFVKMVGATPGFTYRQHYFIDKRLKDMGPADKKWLKDHGYYTGEHEYKEKEDVEVYFNKEWHKAWYIKYDKNDSTHYVFMPGARTDWWFCDIDIRPCS